MSYDDSGFRQFIDACRWKLLWNAGGELPQHFHMASFRILRALTGDEAYAERNPQDSMILEASLTFIIE